MKWKKKVIETFLSLAITLSTNLWNGSSNTSARFWKLDKLPCSDDKYLRGVLPVKKHCKRMEKAMLHGVKLLRLRSEHSRCAQTLPFVLILRLWSHFPQIYSPVAVLLRIISQAFLKHHYGDNAMSMVLMVANHANSSVCKFWIIFMPKRNNFFVWISSETELDYPGSSLLLSFNVRNEALMRTAAKVLKL